MTRAYDALVLDIDGTLLNERETIPERTHAAITRALQAGVVVMLATGRSHGGVREVAVRLGLTTPSVVFNGASVYSHLDDRMVDTRYVGEDLVNDLLAFAQDAGLLPTIARVEGQYAREPEAHEAHWVSRFVGLRCVPQDALPRSEVIRLTLFSQQHDCSDALYGDVARVANGRPAYFTHFPLSALVGFRDSTAQVVDVQPACDGKAEALRVLAARYGIEAARVVAVGDAGNDLPILLAAGLGVAMGNAEPEVKEAADRVIGDNESTALAELIEELFLPR
ncbi:MAG: HAD family hydrolase [Polyangiales bacterium]